MQATTELRAEHVSVLRMLDILHSMADGQRRTGKADPGDLERCVEYLRVFVDRCHHGKEERLLFPAVLEAGVSGADEATIGKLLGDHVKSRAIVARLASGEDFPTAVDDFEALLRPHIMLEENGCFDVADRVLSAEAQKRLGEGYDRLEREVVGEGRHEQFEALLRRLAEKYL